jgi:hypothetical protein
MLVAIGSIFIVLGCVFLFLGPRIARTRISNHFAPEELAATSGSDYRRVRRATIVTMAINMAVGAAFIVAGVRGILG